MQCQADSICACLRKKLCHLFVVTVILAGHFNNIHQTAGRGGETDGGRYERGQIVQCSGQCAGET